MDMSALTPREKEALRLLSQGKTPKEIAAILCVQRTTVYEMLGNVRQKTATTTTLELAIKAASVSRETP
jgi:DNA-binding CsgD family transcriptional regulator